MTDKFDELRAERARQDEELDAFTQTLRRIDMIDVPPGFYEELDAACTIDDVVPGPSAGIPIGLRV